MTREVVVTGVGAVTPLGVGAPALLRRWCAGESGITGGVGRCDDFDPRSFLSVKETRRTDRFTQMAIAAADEALAEAGWDEEPPYARERIGCVFGTGIGGLGTYEDSYDRYRASGARRVSPLTVPRIMANSGAAILAIRHGWHGYTSATVTACAAGADAIASAARTIRAGGLDAAVAGGGEAALSPFVRVAFESIGAISPRGVSQPFDARRDGFVLGEGAGALVLETADGARQRGATALARLRGIGWSSDAHHLTAPDPDGAGALRAMRAALADGGIAPTDIAYVNAHGTSTPLNDRAETLALKALLGGRARSVPVSSTKSAIGHLIGAAGAVEAVATIGALRGRVVPPTLGYEVPEDGLDLDYVGDGPRPLSGSPAPIALSSSFAFGGHNVVLALQAPGSAP